MEDKKTLYRLDDYCKNIILDSLKYINGKKPEDSRDFIHIGDDTYIDVEDLIGYIENLNYEIEHVQEELEDVKQDMEDNCVRRTAWEDSGMSWHDFI